MNLFKWVKCLFRNREKPTESDRIESVQTKLEKEVKTLETREELLATQCNNNKKSIMTFLRKGEKPTAASRLRTLKHNEKQLSILRNQKELILSTLCKLQIANVNKEIVNTLKESSELIKTINTSMNVEKIEKLREKFENVFEETEDIASVLGNSNPINERAIEEELGVLEKEAFLEKIDFEVNPLNKDHVNTLKTV